MRAILVHLTPKNPRFVRPEADSELTEMQGLMATYGALEIVRVIQRKDDPDGETYVGKGKAEELAQIVKEEKIDAIILSDQIKPGQILNLTQIFHKQTGREIAVWDRIMLILKIFEKHAATAEARLQIELAQMRHMGPRMYGLGGTFFSRQGGGIGTRGIGETNIELMKRHWSREMKKVTDKLEKLEENRTRQLESRKERGVISVAIVGYTNAGKTTLFNTLTKKEKYVENELFATLDAVTGKVYLPNLHKEILVSDTIGFIQNLPPQLIQAFNSTLLESIHADVLLHVIDINDPDGYNKIETVESILSDLKVGHTKKIYVFNKIDALKQTTKQPAEDVKSYEEVIEDLKIQFGDFSPVFISAHHKHGIDDLIHKIEKVLEYHL